MWNYALFVPAALALAFLAFWLTREEQPPKATRAASLTAVLWVTSWLLVVASLYARSSGSLSTSFVLQREVGYWAGSALFVLLPFFAVFSVGRLVRFTGWAQPARRVVAMSVAVAAWVITPWLFFAGWVTGCVVLGYQSCM